MTDVKNLLLRIRHVCARTSRDIRALIILSAILLVCCGERDTIVIRSDKVEVTWKRQDDGIRIDHVQMMKNGAWRKTGLASGEYTFLYSEGKPDTTSVVFKTVTNVTFPEKIFKYQQDFWKRSTQPVSLNTAGKAIHFFPSSVHASGDNALSFQYDHELASFSSTWTIDPLQPSDVMVSQTLEVKKDGYYSLASPTLVTVDEKEMAWVTVPGYFQGNAFQDNFVLAYAYGQGVPRLPVVYPERCASSLAAIVDTKEGTSLSVIAEPGLGRDPWEQDKITHGDWQLALSHMNRKAQLSPTLYYPVLGEAPSLLKAGDKVTFSFRYSLIDGDWFASLNHVVYDVYKFKETLPLRRNKQSLTDRIAAMHRYLTDRKTSMWNIEEFDGLKIGGQSYLGGVVGSQGDAMKNSDYGAMWMLASATGDPLLKKEVLPYALNFKLKQQQADPGFFQGAAIGQYYLAKRKKFVEEWGEFVEPVALTYYTMLDIGNILLFEPDNTLLRERLKLGADLLLKWQKADGSWEVAYDRNTEGRLFTDIRDLRPTFYGLLVAHRILNDERYLDGAKKGADWLIKNSIETGHFLGVCGDARYAPDFATAQTAQTLLDLFDITHEEKYREAAIRAARIYTTSIYTHPVATTKKKQVGNIVREDWEIAQAGLSFEHGGIMGSAQRHGPIQLASHAGMFVRVFQLTKDSIFLDMARAAAIGRDAFVDKETSVASYYWNAMNKGAGPYPHHAWWQIGWLTDYLMAEAVARSAGQVAFPRGFVTPKVGPHQTYGFAPGKIFGEEASLIIKEGLVGVSDPNVEYITALSPSSNTLYIVFLNDLNEEIQAEVTLNLNVLSPGSTLKAVRGLMKNGDTTEGMDKITLAPYGIAVYKIAFEKK